MRVVSLNLDQGDATVVRRAIKQALEQCSCAHRLDRRPCPDCQALAATLCELDRLVNRPALGRTPLLTLATAAGCSHTEAAVPVESNRGLAETERLRLLIRDEGVSGNR